MMKKFSVKAGKNLNLRSHIMSIVLMCVSVAMFFYVFNSDAPVPKTSQDSVVYKNKVKQFAKQIASQVTQTRARLVALAESPASAEKLAASKSTLVPYKDGQLPDLMAVRLLSPKATYTNDDEQPVLSFACFDLVYEASKAALDAKDIPVEVHLFGSATQHVDFVKTVRDSQGVGVGALLASFNIKLLQRYISGLSNIGGDIELQQARQVLVSAGANGERAVKPYRAPVVGTRWIVSYWPATNTTEQIINYADNQFVLVSSFAAVILFIAVLLFLRTWLHNRRIRTAELNNAGPETILRKVEEPVTDKSSDDLVFNSGEGLVVEETDINTEKNQTPSPSGDIASIFKAYDIRGVVGKTLTEDVVYDIGCALGSEAQARNQQVMVVGRDGRNSGPVLIAKLISGLRASGIDVINIGLVPTPLLYFAAQTLGTGSGVMLTGSHNPSDYNGLKMVVDGVTLARDDIQAIRQRVENKDFLSGKGHLKEKSVISDYMKRVTADVMLLKKFKVVVDCGNGAAGVIAPSLLKALGCEVIELFCDVDGNFPNHHPDPSRLENLQDLIAAVNEHQADIGLAFDGDGDRLGVVTSEGKVIWPDRIMMLYAMDILSRNPGAEIIFDVKCSTKLKQIIEQHGGKATMWNTGHSLIKAKMKQTGALLAGEMSGHLFFKERWFGFDDGIYSAARLIEILCSMTTDKSVADVFNALPDSVNTPEINIPMAEGTHHDYMTRLLAQARFDDAQVTTIDGLRVDFPDGWGLVRASNTTPVLVLRFEADTDAALQRIMQRFRELMLAVDPDLKLSF